MMRIAWLACFALATMPLPSTAQTAAPIEPPAWTAFTNAWAAIAGYSVTVSTFERKGAAVQNMVLDYNFRKPASATVRIVQGPNSGVTLVWGGGDTLSAHRGSGFIAQFSKTFMLHDPAATTIRGSSIDQLSFAAILDHAQQTPGTVGESPGEVIDGVATDAVSLVPRASSTNAGLTLEIVEISRASHLPLRVLGYEGPTLVRSIAFSNVKLDL